MDELVKICSHISLDIGYHSNYTREALIASIITYCCRKEFASPDVVDLETFCCFDECGDMICFGIPAEGTNLKLPKFLQEYKSSNFLNNLQLLSQITNFNSAPGTALLHWKQLTLTQAVGALEQLGLHPKPQDLSSPTLISKLLSAHAMVQETHKDKKGSISVRTTFKLFRFHRSNPMNCLGIDIHSHLPSITSSTSSHSPQSPMSTKDLQASSTSLSLHHSIFHVPNPNAPLL